MKAAQLHQAGRGRRALAALIRVYQRCISTLKPACCRFHPTCSEYARQAVLEHGVRRGIWMALKRILKCHPLYRGSIHDPVPHSSAERRHGQDRITP